MPAPDLLAFTVFLEAGYPTKNSLGADGFRGGKKSSSFHLLTEAVIREARAEMARTGWEKATMPCEVTIVRYHPTRRSFDVVNAGLAENDAMTKAGVWVDDNLADPFHATKEYDPAGPDRIVIVVRRRFDVAKNEKTTKTAKKRDNPARPAPQPKRAEPAVREPMGLVNGVLTPVSEMEKLYKKAKW